MAVAQCESLYAKVLKRYPDCPELPALPKCAAYWKEKQFEIFIASMGSIVPNGSPSDFAEEQSEETSEHEHAFFECAPRRSSSGVKESNSEVSTSSDIGEESPQSQYKYKGTAKACLVMPSRMYMEDRAPVGLNLSSVLKKFDRCRAAALQSISGLSTSTLVDEYGVGILLSDIYISVETAKLPAVTAPVCVNSLIDLPKMPMLPSLQQLIGSNGEPVCTAIFGQLFVDMKTKMLSQNAEAYNKVKRPCDETFGRGIPNNTTLAVRAELAAKFAPQHPKQGKPFRPTKYLKGMYAVAPSDCDTYDTLYHPMVTSVCEHASLIAGADFSCQAISAFFCKFNATMAPGTRLVTHIFVNETEKDGSRALTIFEKDGACTLCTFGVYGGPLPGKLYQEEVLAVDTKNALALIAWAKTGKYSMKSAAPCDLSALASQ
jgi:hypothetical protein